MIQHIVLFTPKESLSPDERRAFATLVLNTLRQSKHIARCTVGRRVAVDAGYSRSFGDKTYEYAAVLEFEDESQLVAYLGEQSHQALGRTFWEACASSVVCEVRATQLCEDTSFSVFAD